MPFKDPVQRAAYQKAYMARRYRDGTDHRVKHLARVAVNTVRYKADVAAQIAEFRKNGCAVCPEDSTACMDAHHLDPDSKDFSIGNAARQGFSLASLKEELAKCICLCANCHRKFHAGLIELPAMHGAE